MKLGRKTSIKSWGIFSGSLPASSMYYVCFHRTHRHCTRLPPCSAGGFSRNLPATTVFFSHAKSASYSAKQYFPLTRNQPASQPASQPNKAGVGALAISRVHLLPSCLLLPFPPATPTRPPTQNNRAALDSLGATTSSEFGHRSAATGSHLQHGGGDGNGRGCGREERRRQRSGRGRGRAGGERRREAVPVPANLRVLRQRQGPEAQLPGRRRRARQGAGTWPRLFSSPEKSPPLRGGTPAKIQSLRGNRRPPWSPRPRSISRLSRSTRLRLCGGVCRRLLPWRTPRPSVIMYPRARAARRLGRGSGKPCSAARHPGSRKAQRSFAVSGGGLVAEWSPRTMMDDGCRARTR